MTIRYCLLVLAMLTGATCVWSAWDSAQKGAWGWALTAVVFVFFSGVLAGFWGTCVFVAKGGKMP